jgi:hypothetical protein
LTVLRPIVERLRDERYLFFLGVVLVIGTVSFFAVNSTFAWGVLGGALLLIVCSRPLTTFASGARSAEPSGAAQSPFDFPTGLTQEACA